MSDTAQNTDKTKDFVEDDAQDSSLYGLNDEIVSDVARALREEDTSSVKEVIQDLSSADQADLIEKLADSERTQLLDTARTDIQPQTYSELESDVANSLLTEMKASNVASIVSQLDSDDRLSLLEDLDPVFQKDIIQKLSTHNQIALEEGLSFPKDSAGRLMSREFVAIPEFWSVGKTIDYLRETSEKMPENFSDIFLIDPFYHISGEVPLHMILRSPREAKIKDLALEDIHTIPSDADQEDVAYLFKREDISSAPVVDADSRLIGVVTVDDVIDVIEEEAREDILRLGGVEKDDIYRAVFDTTRARFKWLFVNLITAVLASIVIGFFEATIEQIVALAILMPIVASMGGNAGTQTLTIAVRALATKDLSKSNAWRIMVKETLVGLTNGLLFAIIVGLVTYLWFGSDLLALVISMAMAFNLIIAGIFGISIPIILDRFNIDPALASSVFLTTVTDVVGFFVFLTLAGIILL